MVGRKIIMALLVAAAAITLGSVAPRDAQARNPGQPTDWNRFYYYPYVYYPHNFRSGTRQFNHMYYRYPPNRRIPVYNKGWNNFYPTKRPYHKGHHFILDVF